MKERFFLLTLMLLTGIQLITAQVQKVQGTVRDEGGEPVVGASILAIGTQLGTITDVDGKFTLNNLPESVKDLRISYIGMVTAEVKVRPIINVTLKADANLMDEVIVTAFGTAKKSAFTGSAIVLDEEKISRKQISNVLQSLDGEVPGLQISPSTSPGSTSTITVRGTGSINAGTSPLIVLDGMPYDGYYTDINPADVESVTVLKDAASNALYGARGANGVIMVTTKKAKAGDAVITVDAKWGSNSRASRDYDRITDPGQYYEMYYKALYNSYVANGVTPEAAYQQANTNLFSSSSEGGVLRYNVYTVPDGETLIGRNGKLNPNATLGRVVGDYYLYPDNWTDATYQTGLRQEYNVNISGGNDKAQVYASFGYLDDEGIVINSDYTRYTARLKASYQAKSWLNFGGNAAYTRSTRNVTYEDGDYTTGSIFAIAANMGPIYPLYIRDASGNILSDEHGQVYDYGEGGNAGLKRPLAPNSNAISDAIYDKNETVGNSLNGGMFADITFLKDFKFTVNAGATINDERNTSTYNPYYGYYATYNGTLTKYHYRTNSFNFQQLLNYTKQIGEHNISVLLGHENYTYRYEELEATKTNASSYDTNHELNSWLTTQGDPSSYAQDYNTEGYFFRGMYNYNEKYFGSVSFRRDASSRFHPDYRWGNFWSLGAAWIISKERWFNADWLNMLKLKASYGEQGNDDIGYFRYVDTYTIENKNGAASYTLLNKGKKDITWETNANFNAGVEFELFASRLSGSFEFYNRATRNMLYWRSTSNTLGYSGYYDNVGNMRNRGIELLLNGTAIHTRHIDWSLTANLTYNKNTVTYLPDSSITNTIDGHRGYLPTTVSFIGEGLPLNTWYMPKYAGVSSDGQAQYYYTNSDGVQDVTTTYTQADYYLCGSSYPKVYGGFGTSLTAYGFDLNVQFTYALGGKLYDTEYAYLMTVPTADAAGSALHKDLLNAWTPENTSSNIPRWQYGDTNTGAYSDRFLISGSYLSLQNLQVGYTLPKKWLEKLDINKVRVYLTGDNLFLWSKRKGFDPRLTSGYGVYSPMRTVSGGINIQF